MRLVNALIEIEERQEHHLGRLLILIAAFEDAGHIINSYTKLANLDFFLRYPVALERALSTRVEATSPVLLQEFERNSIEASMVRYKFGPWDVSYRRFVNDLLARGLVSIEAKEKAQLIKLTLKGRKLVAELRASPEFEGTAYRASLVHKYFNEPTSSLLTFIYKTFPEISNLSPPEPDA